MSYETGDAAFEAAVSGAAAFARVFGPPYHRKFTPAARVARPLCVCCGKPYGQRNTHDTREIISAPPTPYRGNAFMVEEQLMQWGVDFDEPKAMLIRTTWDGESYYTGYQPFCTLRCALQFGREAYRSGWRSPTPERG